MLQAEASITALARVCAPGSKARWCWKDTWLIVRLTRLLGGRAVLRERGGDIPLASAMAPTSRARSSIKNVAHRRKRHDRQQRTRMEEAGPARWASYIPQRASSS